MPDHRSYFHHIQSLLDTVLKHESTAIEKAVDMLYDATVNKRNIFVFGASHAGILSQELTYRAGGMATMNPVHSPGLMLDVKPVTFTSKMERLEGFGTLIADKTPIQKDDVIITHSVSGRNTVMIDFVDAAKKRGAKIIALTNLTYSKEVESRHPSGKRLFELADLVIDNHGDKGDAAMKFEGMDQKVAPTSTVVGATIVNSMVTGLTQKLLDNGKDVPVLYSANLDGGDEHNQKIFEMYKKNIFYL
ncbi:MAG: sugar isomerase domain-containing protein [Candidatus Izemoplasmataceae bacterium]